MRVCIYWFVFLDLLGCLLCLFVWFMCFFCLFVFSAVDNSGFLLLNGLPLLYINDESMMLLYY